MNKIKIALLLPSRRRFIRLFKTLWGTKLEVDTRFFIAADYPWYEQVILQFFFSKKIVLIDDRKANTVGMVKAYNRALQHALKFSPDYCALWADDLVPANNSWLVELKKILVNKNVDFGIFSTDEAGHRKIFGWNFWGNFPCAHFCIVKTVHLDGFLLHPELLSYCGDNEISIRLMEKNIRVSLLPIRLYHFPSDNETRRINSKHYLIDKNKLYELHPKINGVLSPLLDKGDFRTNFTFVYDYGIYSEVNETLAFIDYDEMIRRGEN